MLNAYAFLQSRIITRFAILNLCHSECNEESSAICSTVMHSTIMDLH